MPDPPLDWRTEIATKVYTLVRDDRVLSRFRKMCAAFPEEKKRDEERLAIWQRRRRKHCLKGLKTIAELQARMEASKNLNHRDSRTVEGTRPVKDSKKTLIHDYFYDFLEPDELERLGAPRNGTMQIEFWVWAPPALIASAAPKLTVPHLFGRFTGNLHSPPFGTDIDPGIASLAEKYASLAALHDARFPERPPIDELHYIDCGRFTEELRRRERKHRRETVDALSESFEASVRAWLTDVEDDLAAQNTKTTKSPHVAKRGSSRMEAKWLIRTAECVHEDTRNPLKFDHYRAMIRDWAEEMVRNARPGTIPARERLRRENRTWTDEEIAKELRKYDVTLDDGTVLRGERALDILHDPITITTHAGTPLNKKYATLAAIHDDSDHCAHPIDPWNGRSFNMGALCGPWGDGSPGPESVPLEERNEAALAMKYAILQSRVADLVDDDRLGVESFLAVVSEDAERATAHQPKTIRNGAPLEASKPPDGDWSELMSWAEVGRRVFGNHRERARKIRLMFKPDDVQQVSSKLIRVRLDGLDALTRRKLENPFRSG